MELQSIYASYENLRLLQSRRHSQTAIIRLEPGSSTGSGSGHDDREQIILVLEGRMKAEIGEETRVIRTGESLMIGQGVKHRLSNEGNATMLAFTVYAPPVCATALPRR